jgi:hypothetical protein
MTHGSDLFSTWVSIGSKNRVLVQEISGLPADQIFLGILPVFVCNGGILLNDPIKPAVPQLLNPGPNPWISISLLSCSS